MKYETSFQLHILSGMHAGASVELERRDYTLGSALESDIVLRDTGIAAHHATLHWDGAKFELIAAAAAEGEAPPPSLTMGAPFRVGPLLVSLSGPPPVPAPIVVAAPPTEVPTAARRTWARRPRALAVLATLTVAGISATSLPLLISAYPRMAWGRSATQPIAVDPAEAVRQRLAALGIGKAAWLEADKDGNLVVTSTLDQATTDRISAALFSLPKPVRVRVADEGILQERLKSELKKRSQSNETSYAFSALGPGRYQIEGLVIDDQERDGLIASLRNELGPAFQIESALRTRSDEARLMLEELRAAHVGSVQGDWNGSKLLITASVPANAASEWERLIETASRAHPGIEFKARLALRAPEVQAASVSAASPASSRRSDGLPFRIRAVSSDWPQHLVLEDGSLLFMEGRHAGWRLASITPTAVVLENAEARRVSVNR